LIKPSLYFFCNSDNLFSKSDNEPAANVGLFDDEPELPLPEPDFPEPELPLPEPPFPVVLPYSDSSSSYTSTLVI